MYKLALSPSCDNVEKHLNSRGPWQFWDHIFSNKLILHVFCVKIMTWWHGGANFVINRVFVENGGFEFGSYNVCRDADISRASFEIWRFNMAIRASLCDVHELLNTPPTCNRWFAPTPTKNGNLSRCLADAVYTRVAAPHDWCLMRLFDFACRWCTINQQENINSHHVEILRF